MDIRNYYRGRLLLIICASILRFLGCIRRINGFLPAAISSVGWKSRHLGCNGESTRLLSSRRTPEWRPITALHGKSESVLHISSNPSPPDRLLLLNGLSVAVVGAGPAGLLLSYRLAQAGARSVSVFEQRPRYLKNNETSSSRAYALGIGIRGRTALAEANNVWERVVRPIGYASDRFILHTPIPGIKVTLRDGSKNSNNNVEEEEPSLLLYQSDLCRVLADVLEADHASAVQLGYECGVTNVNLSDNTISTTDGKIHSSFDLIVGCDGVSSIVRRSMQAAYGPVFQSNQTLLPGVFKVARLPQMPPQLDPTAVQLLLPRSGSATAFCEPVENGACCLLIAGNNETDVLLQSYENSNDNAAIIIEEALRERFPKLDGAALDIAAQQLQVAKQGRASKVMCNIYHAQTACLVGDAAHATGGVSGQGLNSALVDTGVLINSLIHHYDANNKAISLQAGLLEYSQRAVPEGHALADLSFEGRGNLFTTVRDFVFQGRWGIGKPLLQTQLTSSRESFASIRRNRQSYFTTVFPSKEMSDAQIQLLHQTFIKRSS